MSYSADGSGNYTDPNAAYYDPNYAAAYWAQYYNQAGTVASASGTASYGTAADYGAYYDAAAAASMGTAANGGYSSGGGPMRHDSSSSAARGTGPYSKPIDPKEAFAAAFGKDKKERKAKPAVRVAGGQVWEDATLTEEWDQDDFRIFCGDLSNDMTDQILENAFKKYPSFQKARVVRDKRTGKTKGYGFVSFKDVNDYMAAMKEMNGKYVGNRPLKLRKSDWKERSVAPKQLKKVMENDVMKLAQMASKKRV